MNFDISKLTHTLTKMGGTLLETGMSYAIMKDNMQQGSIFGGGGCCMGGGYGMNPMMMGGNPFMGGMGMGGGYGMNPMMMGGNPFMGGMGGATNPYLSGYGVGFAGGDAYALGVQTRLQIEAEQMASGKMKTNNLKADKVNINQETALGDSFEKAQKDMMDAEGKPIEDKEFTFMSDDWIKLHNKDDKTKTEKIKEAKDYKRGISEFGKSYLMSMDKASGNANGELNLNEFIAAQLKNLPEDADDKQKAQAKQMATNLFSKLDQNVDKVIDWKENASMLFALDNDTQKGGKDGSIASDDLAKYSELASAGTPNKLDEQLRKGYSSLFGNDLK